MYLGIEIGGTKLQLGIGTGGNLEALERRDVDISAGAEGIRAQIEAVGRIVCQRYPIEAVGYGFGGPVNSADGTVVTSHQVSGWDNFPLRKWTEDLFSVPVHLGNDCDAAAIAEARFGAGAGQQVVFYVTVGTGVGGGLVIGGELHGLSDSQARPLASAEIGHLRPGLIAENAHHTVESISSGMGIETRVREQIQFNTQHPVLDGQEIPTQELEASFEDDRFDLTSRCSGDLEQLTAQMIAEAAADGNGLALCAIDESVRTLGWAIGQVVSLTAPSIVVVGGGVSLMDETLFYLPLREYAKQYVFPPLRDRFEIVPPTLGEEVVVHGALAFAEGAKGSPKS
ncbi:MAG: hypothetical protein CMJ78_01655 [Planctomycetaceae bacterium]|nr:hypothetical protein [Planctomycetaceae bacterium]